MSTALLVVDVQRGLVEGERAVPDATAFVTGLGDFLARARRAGTPVIHLRDAGSDAGSRIAYGTPAWELVLAEDGEVVVDKEHDDGFDETELAHVLDAQGGRYIAAADVSRVAEWSLGDTVEVPACLEDVRLNG